MDDHVSLSRSMDQICIVAWSYIILQLKMNFDVSDGELLSDQINWNDSAYYSVGCSTNISVTTCYANRRTFWHIHTNSTCKCITQRKITVLRHVYPKSPWRPQFNLVLWNILTMTIEEGIAMTMMTIRPYWETSRCSVPQSRGIWPSHLSPMFSSRHTPSNNPGRGGGQLAHH